MASLIDKLRRQSQFELQLMGEAPDSVDRRSATSTHPAPVERRTALAGHHGGDGAGRDRPRGLPRRDQRHVGRRCAAGRLRARQQVPPSPAEARLRGAARLPSVQRPATACWASAATARCCSSPAPREPMPGSLADWMRNKLKPTPTDIQATEIDGAEAAIGARPRGSDTGLGQVRYVMVPAWRSGLLLQSVERGARIATAGSTSWSTPHARSARCPTPRRQRSSPIACA